MNTVRWRNRQVNGKKERRQAILAELPLDGRVASVVEIIQALVPLGSMHLEEAMQAEVARVAGERFRRCDGQPGHV